ncbi:GNAT family N-acetyltransferase [Mucilaginibacter psychrotolerans]|uniref:GNAT family N-acetyltransferase n=1 Tax=Mucilaginibacter psychrotolerans TaxID=1524096 RepID=UPI0013053D74|nr:GNAT family N-acetyltransferase [Mucilaginibacter psychrotolerans]
MTAEDIAEVEAIGFNITSGKKPLKDFLLAYFPGFDLREYLKEIGELLTPLTQAKIEKELAYFEEPPPMIIVQFYSEDEGDDETGLALSRAFIRHDDELIAEHDFFRIPETARGQGIGKKMLNLSLQQYLRLGVDKIVLEAALADGSYVWAKAFFTATVPTEVKMILDEAEKCLSPAQFKFVKRVYDNYYSKYPNGKAFPMVKWSRLEGMETILRKSRWHGEIDLNNSELLAKFKYYVA